MSRSWTVLIVAAALTAGAGLVSAQSKPASGKAAALKNPVPSNAASIKTGQQLYAKQCRHCHGLQGKGDGPLAPSNPKPSNLTDGKWDYGSTDGEIFNVIWNGAPKPKTEMKGMSETLSQRDVWNIVNYVRSIGPKPPKP
jgi:putative copper resistance protein D